MTEFSRSPRPRPRSTRAALDAWRFDNDPLRFRVALEFRLDALPRQGSAVRRPWADSYWPTYQDGINHRWQRTGSFLHDLSPAEKYDAAFNGWDPQRVANLRPYRAEFGHFHEPFDHGYYDALGPLATECSRRFGNARTRNAAAAGLLLPNGAAKSGNASEDFGGLETWFGLCHAWAPAAILEEEPLGPVEHNGIRFEVSDIKALLIACYNGTSATMVGARNDERDMDFDDRGRAEKADARDVNPGAFHVLLANLLGRDGRSFCEDRTANYEVWNQPIQEFRTRLIEEVSEEQAAALVETVAGDYHFDEQAVKFYRVETEVDYITESPASTRPNADGAGQERTDPYAYVLEVNANGEIIGGEWVGSSRKEHPDFLWLPHGAYRALSPFVVLDEVRTLLRKSRDQHQPDAQAISLSFSIHLNAGEVVELEPFVVSKDGVLEFVMAGRGDVDAYARVGQAPEIHGAGDKGVFDLIMYDDGSNQRATMAVRAGQRIHVAMRGFVDDSSATLRIVQM
ncbi:hypothetical protein [Paraliomyxa miuraensis]|uniref:hypothetical protein n=1 Tax=Paraliomyxa miuraensis TaxID=376150 RepID=UPI0022533B09|nr:hypothetical protein [Paraliomyxa miuraensis]MCX4247484.1 hypothetical protein [Paraliomyxa miuraensis]